MLGPGSVLDLNGLNLYYRTFTDLGGTIELNGGKMMLVPEPAGAVVMLLATMMAGARRRR